MAENICEKLGRYRSWSHATGVSNHKVVVLQLDFDRDFCHYQFNFNHTWLLDEDFNDLVVKKWARFTVESPVHLNLMQRLVYKLDKLKLEVLCWVKEKKKDMDNP